MIHLHNLKEHLQERKVRFERVRYEDFVGETVLFLDFIRSNHYTAALLDLIDSDNTVSFEQWRDDSYKASRFALPSTEMARAKVCLGILTDCIAGMDPDAHFEWAHLLGHADNEDQVVKSMGRFVVEPLINVLQDRIAESDQILYLIQRFKAKAEWFRREEMNAAYVGNTKRGEETLDKALRESLFDGGIDNPLSQPDSPSGRADIVALLGSNKLLVLEVKVFDPHRGRGTSHIRQGFHQIVKYATDYNESVGYLVVFNCSAGPLAFQQSHGEPERVPPRVMYGGKTYYLITIDIGIGRPSASKEKPASRIVISFEDLTESAS